MEMRTVACYPSVFIKPYTGSHPRWKLCIPSQPAVIPKKKKWTTGFQLFLLRYQSILYLLDDKLLGEVWWGETVSVPPFTDLLLWEGGPRHAHDKVAKRVTVLRLKHKEMMASLGSPPADPGAEVSSLACCPSSMRFRGPSLLQPHDCFSSQPHHGRKVVTHCPSLLLAEKGVFPVFYYFSQGHHKWI